MAHESFEDTEVAARLNEAFISIKVDKEERPDIDSIYMNVCQVLTGSGGWPTTIFMTPDQKPFFAGTYFPKESRHGRMGFLDLLQTIRRKWTHQEQDLVAFSHQILNALQEKPVEKSDASEALIEQAVTLFQNTFDEINGGFGTAPKFPTPHNLLFLMRYDQEKQDKPILAMVEKTLLQMYKGGMFDHIGFGFSRYSTDNYFLVPHFEKMLYDNALLMMSYARAFDLTKNELYQSIAEKTAAYVLRELTSPDGAFYCAQDADSEGVEGKYYVFDYDEIITLLGREIGEACNAYYGITKRGNFEGKNIPNLLAQQKLTDEWERYLPQIYDYRKTRTQLHLDDKILTAWNALMIAAFAILYRVFGNACYLEAAKKACRFLEKNLSSGDQLFVSYRDGTVSGHGFLDDYAFYIHALLHLYEATLETHYLERAIALNQKAIEQFYDEEKFGFYLYGSDNEALILRPKETYDGAIPSGNSVMAYNLVKLSALTHDEKLEAITQNQMEFMASAARHYPSGNSFYLLSLLMFLYPSKEVVCVLKEEADRKTLRFPLDTSVKILSHPTDEYPLLNDKTTFYVCEHHSCQPPTNDWRGIVGL